MATRRAFAAFTVLAALATAWLLIGPTGADRSERAEAPPGLGPTRPDSAASEKRKPDGVAAPAPPGVDVAAASRLLVRVIHADGSPAARATVEVYAADESNCGGFPSWPAPAAATATADHDGKAAIPMAPWPCWARATRGDAASFPEFAAAGGAEITLVLEPARALRGTVLLPEGAPAAGFAVSLTFTHAVRSVTFGCRTDDAGAFGMAAPDAWLDRLAAVVRAKPDPAVLPEPSHWEFEFAREQLRGGSITLQLTVVRLRARVVDDAGLPVEGAMVHWAPPGAPDPPSFRFVAVTDEDGRFETAVQRLAGAALVIKASGYAPLVWRPDAPPSDRKLSVPEIVLGRGATLAGRVTDPAGAPVRAFVRLESPRLPGQVVEEDATDDDGRFRFAVADGEHVLYAFRTVEPDLCLPQLRVERVRGGPDEVRVVLPDPILGTIRFVAQGTGEAVSVEHLTLIIKDARGAEVAKRTWDPGHEHRQVRFELWDAGTYAVEVYTARHEPARMEGVQAVRGRGPEVAVPLVPRR